MCFHCGESLGTQNDTVQPDISLGKNAEQKPDEKPIGSVCPHCQSILPEGLTVCFRCGKSLLATSRLPEEMPVQADPDPLRSPVIVDKKKWPVGIIAAAVVVLLLCGAVGGHFMGLYSLPLLPTVSEKGETPPPVPTPDSSQENTPASTTTPGSEDRIIRFEDGNVYEGDIVDGKPHGRGTMTYGEASESLYYEGEWRNGLINGKGVMSWLNGDFYDGEWRDGLLHGEGIMLFANDDVYQGEFQNGYLHGQGILTTADGNVIRGMWEDGMPVNTSPSVQEETPSTPLQTIDGVIMGTYKTSDYWGEPSIVILTDDHRFDFTINFGATMVGIYGSWEALGWPGDDLDKSIIAFIVEDAIHYRNSGWLVEDYYTFEFHSKSQWNEILILTDKDGVGLLNADTVFALTS